MKGFEVLLILFLGIYSAITVSNWKKIGLGKKLFVIVSLILAVVVAWNTIADLNKQRFIDKITASFGEINDLDNATVPMIKLGMKDRGPGIILDKNGVLGINNLDLLKLFIKNDKLYIDVVIRDSNGEPILAIYENEWEKYNDSYEFNNDVRAVELVTKGERKVFFHVELIKGSARIEGVLLTENKDGIYIFDKDTTAYGAGFTIFENGRYKLLNSDIIKPLFKYPRDKYLGLRADYTSY